MKKIFLRYGTITFRLVVFALVLTLGHGLNAQGTSLYSDIKARQVGDVITVIVAETTTGSSISKNNASSNSGIDISAKASGSVVANNPSIGGSGSIGTGYNGQNGAEQKEKLTGRITVQIIEISESGMLKIEGERVLGVNGEGNLMRIEGYIRSRDISTNNTIYSYQIANAEITYRQDGLTDGILAPGTFSRIMAYSLGGLMVAAAAGYFAFSE